VNPAAIYVTGKLVYVFRHIFSLEKAVRKTYLHLPNTRQTHASP